jgi:hypothetical protein
MPTVYYPPNVVELLSGKTREPLCGIDFTNYTVAISPTPAGPWGIVTSRCGVLPAFVLSCWRKRGLLVWEKRLFLDVDPRAGEI